ncbi:MAG: hypothetical protein JHD25_04475 [Sphingomonadaceae bacterium]|nr:hypothetical protein [Sphingomonadaceae bacterium]MBJ7389814.1 hypothetical protein [Sphingomonadaceae bacterium]MBJ7527692.1 hypothetical protein [Sphingomonadaceae bacterium]
MAKMATKLPSDKMIRVLLAKHACPVGYHEVRTRLLGVIARPDPDVKPMTAIADLWGGELPEFDSMEDANELLGALVMGLWNELSAYQDPKIPFRAMPVPMEPTAANLANFGMIRSQEAGGFVEGLFDGADEARLPERAHEAVTHLGEIRAMMLGVADLIERTAGEPEDRAQIKETIKHLRTMTEIMEAEIHAAVLSCVRARQQGLPGLTAPWPARH